MKQFLKRVLHPLRVLAAKFVAVDAATAPMSIMQKAAHLIAAEKVEGDYLEFGVFAGDSFIRAYHSTRQVFEHHQKQHPWRTAEDSAEIGRLWNDMRFFAFDSFQGLPEISGIDRQTSDFAAGKFNCTEPAFRDNLARAGVPLSRVTTIAGWFENSCTEETIRRHGLQKAAIIHIDCDLYSSTKTVLNFIRPLLTDGSIIIFDDWYCFRGNPDLGEQKAFQEWKEVMPEWTFTEYQKEGPWRNSFIASRRGPQSESASR
jgi:O-methyltransferase